MQIIVLRNTKHTNSYTSAVHTLLEEIGRSSNYTIQHASNVKDVPSVNGNAITFIKLAGTSFIARFLQQQQLAAYINKNKTDLLIQNAIAPIKQKRIAQLIIADDIERLPAIKKISYSKIFLLTYSQFAKQVIADKGFTNIVHVVPLYAEAMYQPINWSMKQQIKIDFTEGREYFIVPNNFTSINDLLNLLKAFTGFKKWQQSSMKLVLTGKLHVPPGDWKEKLNTYKYREDVLMYNKLGEEEKWKLLAGAYASIHLPAKDNDLLPLLQTMQCHTPAIVFETASGKEYAADAVLPVATGNYEELTEQMILMYKDEGMRNKLIENCALHSDEFSKEKAIQALQNIIL